MVSGPRYPTENAEDDLNAWTACTLDSLELHSGTCTTVSQAQIEIPLQHNTVARENISANCGPAAGSQ